MSNPKSSIRGIRDSIPGGYVLGRTGGGSGPPVLLPLNAFADKSYVANTTIQVNGPAGGDLSGTYPNPVVIGLRGTPIKNQAPTDGQILKFVMANTDYEPVTPTANPSATAADVAVNGTAQTFMRSDAAPAVQKASASQFGIVKVDGSTITAVGGVISSTGGSLILGSGAPASVQPAGTLYSRTDQAGLYVSFPIITTPGIVQTSLQDNNSVGSPASITFSANVTPGNLLIAVLFEASPGSRTAATGWTQLTNASESTNSTITVYYRIAQAGDNTSPPAVVTTGPNSSSAWMNVELSGATIANLDASNGAGVASGSSTTGISITTTQVNDLVLGFVGQLQTFSNQPSIGSPYTLLRQNQYFHDAVWLGDATAAAAGAFGATITWGSGYTSACYMQLAFKSATNANWIKLAPLPPGLDGIIDRDVLNLTGSFL